MPPIRKYALPYMVLSVLSATCTVSAGGASVQIIPFNGGSADFASAIVTDTAGNIIIAGEVRDDSKPVTFAVIKQNPQGVVQWVSHYAAAPGERFGRALAVAVDNAGNVYAAGSVFGTGSASDTDWLTVSFGPDGIQRWAHSFASAGAGFDQATAIVRDQTGNLYVTGFSGDGIDFNWLTVKYTANGQVLWQRVHQGASSADDRAIRAVVDPFGDLIVLGWTSNVGAGLAKDITLVKYSAQGNKLWEANFTETAQSDELPMEIALDSTGDVYVTGETVPTTNPELEHVPITLKYAAGGQRLFVLRGDGCGGTSVAVDGAGDVLVSGTSFRQSGQPGVTATAKFNRFGSRIWLVRDVTGRIATDSSGDVYLSTGSLNLGSADRSDYLTVKLDPAGSLLWEHRFTPGDSPAGMTIDGAGNLLVTGNSNLGPSAQANIFTLRFPPDFAPAPLDAPSNLQAAGGIRRIGLRWQDNSTGEAGFRIERCTGLACTNFAQVAQVAAGVTTFVNTGLANNTVYTYRVRAFHASGNSAYSNVARARTR